MTTLNPLAVTNAPLLRELAAAHADLGNTATVNDIARAVGRDESNVRKSIKALAGEGLVDAEARTLTGHGLAQLAAIDRAEGQGPDGTEPASPPATSASGMLGLYHAQILPDSGNARRDWESQEAILELDALREDLLLNGLLQNLVVRAAPADDIQGVSIERTDAFGTRHTLPLYRLVGGERRWRAIAEAIRDGDWPEDRLIPCRELTADDLGCRLAALAENIQRRNLNPIEKARAFEGLAEAGLTNQQIADRIVATPEHVQQHRRFLQLDDNDQQRMTLPKDDPGHLSVRDARSKLAKKVEDDLPELSPAARLVLGELGHATRKADPRSWWVHIPVDSTAMDDPAVAELTALRVITVEGPDYQTGEFRATIRYEGWHFAGRVFSWLNDNNCAEAIDLGLCELQGIGLDGVPFDTYVTPWLNGPFELTDAGKAIVADRAADAAAQAERSAYNAAIKEAARQRILAAQSRADALFSERHTATAPAVDDRLPDILTALDHPLPWTAGELGGLFDANGNEVADLRDWHSAAPAEQGRSLARVIAMAVNAGGGHATPEAPPQPPAKEDDEPDQDIDGNDPDAEADSEEFADDGDATEDAA
jgi:ParB/RepB/Spo0J family partition protein